MSLRKLPEARVFARPQNYQWDAPSDVLTKWAEHPLAAAPSANGADTDTTISLFDVIGEDGWSGGGVTANRISAALRSIGNKDITVRINSPGGDMFEGIAIYNLLRAHPAKVTVEVLGWAASAASIIAMAGDDIRMGLGSFMMVYNAWGVVIGNRHDMREAAELFDQFDAALADIYEARTGMKRADIEQLMDAETFMTAAQTVEYGFADVVDDAIDQPEGEAKNMDRGLMARRQTEAALARAGFSRETRSEMLLEMGVGARDAAHTPAARDAGILGRALVTQTWRQDFVGFADHLALPISPAIAIVSISYFDVGNVQQTLDPGLYDLFADARGAHVALRPGQSWPATFRRADAVSIAFTAGYGAAADVPEPIRHAILLIVQRLYDGADTEIDVCIERTVHALIAPYRKSPL